MKKAIIRIARHRLGDDKTDLSIDIDVRAGSMAALIAKSFFIEWPDGVLDIGFPDDDDWDAIYPSGLQIECLGEWKPQEEDDLGLIVIGVREEGEWIE